MSHRCSKCFKSTFGVFPNLKSKSTKSTSSVLASFSVTLSKSTFRVLYNLGGGFGAKVQIHLFFKSTKSTRSTKSTALLLWPNPPNPLFQIHRELFAKSTLGAFSNPPGAFRQIHQIHFEGIFKSTPSFVQIHQVRIFKSTESFWPNPPNPLFKSTGSFGVDLAGFDVTFGDPAMTSSASLFASLVNRF